MTTPSPPSPPPTPRPPVPAAALSERFDPAGLAADDDTPPTTGHPEVDRALEGVVGLGDEPLTAHPDRLARAHEALHAQLQDPSRDDAGR
jgi:hypothetical protein